MTERVNLTEHIGLQEVGLLFLRELGWVYRPHQQPTLEWTRLSRKPYGEIRLGDS